MSNHYKLTTTGKVTPNTKMVTVKGVTYMVTYDHKGEIISAYKVTTKSEGRA